MTRNIYVGLLFLGWVLSGCMTPSEKKQIQTDLFNAQARILKLERTLANSSQKARSTGESANKRIASTQATMDKIFRDLRQIRGEIDALRVGVITGQMPGLAPSERAGSVAASIQALDEKVLALEASQKELLDIIKNSGSGDSNTASRSREPAETVDGLQKAFDEKRYAHVAADAPDVLKEVEGDDKEQGMFLLAESLYKLGKLRDAALKFNEFIESNPSKRYLPVAKMRMGDCFRHLGDPATASLYYQELVKEFPETDEASKAKERLGDFAESGTNRG